MPIEFACECGRSYRVADQMAGKRAKCKQCGRAVEVPWPAPAEPEDPFNQPAEAYAVDGAAHGAAAANDADAAAYDDSAVPQQPGRPGEMDFLSRLVVSDTAQASNTARAKVDLGRYFASYPQGAIVAGVIVVGGIVGGILAHPAVLIAAAAGVWMVVQEALQVRAKFLTGDVNPAVVVSAKPWRVAIWADMSTGRAGPRPALLIQDLPLHRMVGGPPPVGTPLAAVSVYFGNVSADAWVNVHPTLVHLGVADRATADRVVASVSRGEWKQLQKALARLGDRRRPGFYELWKLGPNDPAAPVGAALGGGLKRVGIAAAVVAVAVVVAVLVAKKERRARDDAPAYVDRGDKKRPAGRSGSNTDGLWKLSGKLSPGTLIDALDDGDEWSPAVVVRVEGSWVDFRYDLPGGNGGEDRKPLPMVRLRGRPDTQEPGYGKPPPPPPTKRDGPTAGGRKPAREADAPPAVPQPPSPREAEQPAATPVAPPAEDARPVDPAVKYGVGQAVQILWGNKWWPGKVKRVDADGYRVGYDGWSESFDETVKADRLKTR